jgi:dihydroneopterin aldolase
MTLLQHPKLENHRCIFFDQLELSVSIGIHAHEKEKKQPVLIWLEMYFPLKLSSPKNDSIDEVLDYDLVRSGIRSIAEKKHFFLQETLSEEISKFCIKLANVSAIKLKIAKKEAYNDCKSVGVETVTWSSN